MSCTVSGLPGGAGPGESPTLRGGSAAAEAESHQPRSPSLSVSIWPMGRCGRGPNREGSHGPRGLSPARGPDPTEEPWAGQPGRGTGSLKGELQTLPGRRWGQPPQPRLPSSNGPWPLEAQTHSRRGLSPSLQGQPTPPCPAPSYRQLTLTLSDQPCYPILQSRRLRLKNAVISSTAPATSPSGRTPSDFAP